MQFNMKSKRNYRLMYFRFQLLNVKKRHFEVQTNKSENIV